jgi:hypothetical protein
MPGIDGTFTTNINLSNLGGDNKIIIIAFDLAGNSATKDIIVNYTSLATPGSDETQAIIIMATPLALGIGCFAILLYWKSGTKNKLSNKSKKKR